MLRSRQFRGTNMRNVIAILGMLSVSTVGVGGCGVAPTESEVENALTNQEELPQATLNSTLTSTSTFWIDTTSSQVNSPIAVNFTRNAGVANWTVNIPALS